MPTQPGFIVHQISFISRDKHSHGFKYCSEAVLDNQVYFGAQKWIPAPSYWPFLIKISKVRYHS